jgi:SPP1 gp7 family putative phage head morphogenesis protein
MVDERTTDINLNVNEEIQDRTIRHMVYLERYKGGEVRRIRRVLDSKILPDITDKLRKRLEAIVERGSDLGPVTTSRLVQLERELARLNQNMINEVKNELVLNIDDFSANEIEWQVATVRESLGFDLDFVIPPPRSVGRIIKKTSFAGLTLDQWFDTLARSTQRNVMSAVNRGIVEGETTDQIMRRIRGTKRQGFTDGVWNTTRRQAETITRSVVNHATNQARLELFKENDDILEGLQWTSTLDGRTSTICAGLDGRIFPLDKGPRPPAHPNCRSTMTAVLKDWKSLGLSNDNLSEEMRASINGQVPASVTYGTWLKRQPILIQEDVLGVSKAKLFRDGGVSIERFTDARLKPLTLDQLRKVEKKAFDKVGL